jgi:hypothetical protein
MQDLEAQDLSTSLPTGPTPGSTNPAPNSWARSGRGGAGNFIEPSVAVERQNLEESTAAQAAAHLKKHTPRGGAMALGGRGGAGNYAAVQDDSRKVDEEKGRAAELERNVKQVVDQELKMPEKAHQSRGAKGEVHQS